MKLMAEPVARLIYQMGVRSYLIGNLIQQGVNASNSNLVGYAKEGASNLVQEIYIPLL